MASSSSKDSILLRRRKETIHKLLLTNDVDLQALKTISRQSGGFIDNETRSRVWPKLLGINRFKIPDYENFIEKHRDDVQVKLDIERSLWCHEHTEIWPEPLRERRRQALKDIIMAVLCRNPNLHYYQGYHDVVSVFLLVFEDDHLAFALTEVVSSRYLVDFLAKDFEILCRSMRMIMTIINVADVAVGKHLSEASVEPFFATSWLITWFAHDVKKINDIARIYDAILCSHPLYSFYLCAAMVISVREMVLECECDFASVFDLLVHAPVKIGISIEDLITLADNIMFIFPPEKLRKTVDAEVRKIIDRDLVKCFHVPPHLKSCSVQADWVLLQNLHVTPRQIMAAAAVDQNHGKEISIRNDYWSSLRLNLLQNARIFNQFERIKNVPEASSSYVGPFKGTLDLTLSSRNLLRSQNSKFGVLPYDFLNLLHIVDDNTFSLATLLCGATFLTCWIAGAHYYTFNDFKTRPDFL